MARRIQAKLHNPQAFSYDGSPVDRGFTVSTLVINNPNTAIADFMVLAMACKIPRVHVVCSSATSGVTAFNIVIGAAAESTTAILKEDNTDVGVVPPTVNTTAGLALFDDGTKAADQALAIASAYGTKEFLTSRPDAIFPANTPLTLRYVSGGAVAGIMKVALIVVPVDLYPAYPFAFNWGLSCVG